MSLNVHTEREIKFTLPRGSYAACRQALLEKLPTPWLRLQQTNRFYDTQNWDLAKRHCSIRLRLQNQRLLLTCKQRQAEENGAFTSKEWESWLNPTLWYTDTNMTASTLPLPQGFIDQHDTMVDHGGFSNLRLQTCTAGETIALDHGIFPQSEVVELEIETSDLHTSKDTWTAFLEDIGVTPTPSSKSKLQRYHEEKPN